MENSPKIVEKFSWISGHPTVTSDYVVDQEVSKLMFPKWFVDKIKEINKKIDRMKETNKKEDK